MQLYLNGEGIRRYKDVDLKNTPFLITFINVLLIENQIINKYGYKKNKLVIIILSQHAVDSCSFTNQYKI